MVCLCPILPLSLQPNRSSVLSVMDPLSVTGSIIAIVTFGGQLAKGIRRLASLRDAPDSPIALNNEITDLNLVVLAIQDIYQRQQTAIGRNQTHNANVDSSVMSALNQADHIVRELQRLYDRLSRKTSGPGGLTSLNRTTWLLEQKKVKKLQEDLRNARLKLAGALGVLNSSVRTC